METQKEILSFDEVRKLLSIKGNRLTRLMNRGLPYISLGYETNVFLRSSVSKWLKSIEKNNKI